MGLPGVQTVPVTIELDNMYIYIYITHTIDTLRLSNLASVNHTTNGRSTGKINFTNIINRGFSIAVFNYRRVSIHWIA